jgi:acetyl esterase/lipase
MPSLRSRFFYRILRFRTSRPDRNATLQSQRADLESSARFLPMPRSVAVQRIDIGRAPAEWLRPPGTPEHRAVLYLHGGGHAMGSAATHRALAARIAVAARTPALLPELHLAPEHPFPAALDDGMAAYRWLIENGASPHGIVIAGDSSGGGLAIALSLSLRDASVPLPAAIVCLSPWTDLALTGESIRSRADVDPLCSLAESTLHAARYVGTHDPRTPLISPLYADLHGLPPTLTQVGDREILLSDSLRLTDRARAAGVDAELEVWDGMWHVWHLLAAYVPEGRQAIDRIGAFIRGHLHPGSPGILPSPPAAGSS